MERLQQISAALQEGDDGAVAALTRQALDGGATAEEILAGGLIAGMDVVGARFRDHQIFLPDVLLAARAMQAGMALLEPLFLQGERRGLGKVVIGTVQGDIHDIGKNLVGIMLQGAGFEVIDLGKDVAPEAFVDAAVEADAGIIGMSTLLTTTMPAMARVVAVLRERGLHGRIRTIAGGAPVTPELIAELGIDAYGYDAANAVDRLKELTAAPAP
ncbi:MAG: corrinoid protein [Acidobacteriota bacterium]|jgi:5-methyltetrahydrofolate--homocysteine methyltransferase